MTGLPDPELLPPDISQTISQLIAEVQKNIVLVRNDIKGYGGSSSKSVGKCLKYVTLDRHSIHKLLEHLASTERALDTALLLVTLRLNFFTYEAVRRLPETLSVSEAKTVVAPKTLQKTRRYALLHCDSFLRRIGIYGHFVHVKEQCQTIQKSVWGLRMPECLGCATTCELSLTKALHEGGNGSHIWSIATYHRVSADSPFMIACRREDSAMIKQHLRKGTGSVIDRTACTGKTPLLLVIEGAMERGHQRVLRRRQAAGRVSDDRHLEADKFKAVEYLLENGADPNIGDDNEVLPVFAITGFNPSRNLYCPQLPPTWNAWIDVLKALVNKGASVHEVLQDRPLGSLNIVRDEFDVQVLEFFQVLKSEHYQDFNGAQNCSSLASIETAIKARHQAVEALKFLKKSGADFSIIGDDGGMAIHSAAETGESEEVLNFVFSQSPLSCINRGDAHGWTPLHYCIFSGLVPRQSEFEKKVRYLLAKGADPHQRCTYMEFWREDFETCPSPLELASKLKPSIYNWFIQAVKAYGHQVPPKMDECIFEDALDS